ncbi:MAG: iron ABC transporter permease, partial [Armatimonadetes bacterium]|nr:iron ABC transporter permease [Armatimonadota bacterium]
GAAWVGGLLSLALVFALGGPERQAGTGRLLLAGVVVGTMLGSITVLILLLGHRDTNQILRWMMGSTSPMFWERVVLLAFSLVAGALVLLRQARALNTVAMTGRLASTLGVDADRLTRIVLWTGSAMVGVCVGAVGLIGFVGLAAPHIARTLFGPDLRKTLPASALLGGTLLLFADVIAIRLLPGVEMPVGAVTAVLGAPVLLYLLRQRENAI